VIPTKNSIKGVYTKLQDKGDEAIWEFFREQVLINTNEILLW